MASPSNDPTTDYNQLAQGLFTQITNSLSVRYDESPDVTHEYCEKYDISPTWELARLRRAFRRRRRNDQHANDDTTLRQVEERIKNTQVRQFIAEHFNGATTQEQKYLLQHIGKEFEEGDSYGEQDWDYSNEHSLQNLLKLGLPGIRKLRAKESRKKAFKSSIGIVWAIIKGLAQIAIVLSIYAQLQNSFQSIVVSILLTIYTTVALQVSYSAVRYSTNLIKADAQFSDLREVLGKPLDSVSMALMDQATKDIKGQEARILIYQFTLGIVDLIALWKIIRAIGWF